MTPDEFNQWRKDLRLSLRGAAKILYVSLPTVQGYDRGFRPDDRRPVVIPEKVALACEALTARARAAGELSDEVCEPLPTQAEPEVWLPIWGDFPRSMKAQVLTKLEAQPLTREVPSEQMFLTKLDRFNRVADDIMSWLAEHADKGHQLRILNHPDLAEGQIVVLEIADPDQALEFKLNWYGAKYAGENQP